MIHRAAILSLTLVAGTCCVAACSQAATPAAPAPAAATQNVPVVAEPASIDYGTLKPGQGSMQAVTVRSLVDQPLTIAKIATCSCIEVRVSSMTIPPRGQIRLEASITPKAGLGEKREQIQLAFAGHDSAAVIDVHAEVAMAIRMEPSKLDARPTESGAPVTSGVIEVSSVDDKPFKVLATAGQPPTYIDFNPAVDQPRSRYKLKWDLSGYSKETMPGWWVIETDRDDAPILDVRVWHEWTKVMPAPDRRAARDQRIVVGRVKAGEPYEFTTRIQWGHRQPRQPTDATPAATLKSVSTDSSQFAVELIKTELVDYPRQTDLVCSVRVTAKSGKPGLIYGKVTYTTPDGRGDTWTIIGQLTE